MTGHPTTAEPADKAMSPKLLDVFAAMNELVWWAVSECIHNTFCFVMYICIPMTLYFKGTNNGANPI